MRLPLILAALLLATSAAAQETTPAAPTVPEAPVQTAPATPAPAAPAAEAPAAAPAAEAPAPAAPATTPAPAAEAPTATPAAPAAQTPATPATTTPTAQAPAAPAPEAAATTAPAAPAPAATDAPAASTTQAPAAAPASDAPTAVDTPAAAAPDPETPAPVAADTPSTASAETPATGTDASTASAPATPAAPAAQAPVELDVPHQMALTPKEMFLEADIVVKAVMIGLAFASVVTWTVFIVKLIELAAAIRRAIVSHRQIEAAGDIASAVTATSRRSDPASAMVRAAAREMDRSAPALAVAGQQGVKERVASHLDRIEARASRRIARGTGLLATVGSTAPFVGLFGTVWGIMNSFIGIAESQTTNLSIVAPGIAEALLATGIGLVAAIPAVVIYNMFARATAGYRLKLGDASASVQRLVSRELDMKGVAR